MLQEPVSELLVLVWKYLLESEAPRKRNIIRSHSTPVKKNVDRTPAGVQWPGENVKESKVPPMGTESMYRACVLLATLVKAGSHQWQLEIDEV